MNDQQKKFQAKLRAIYKKQDTIEPLIQGLEGDDKIPSKKMNECFIKLNTMVAENDEKKQKSTDKISDKKQEIEIEKLFDKGVDEKAGKTSESNKLMILGPAGMGKSTLMKYIAYKWGVKELWKSKFDFVYRVPLKTLADRAMLDKIPDTPSSLKHLVCFYLNSLIPYPENEKVNFQIEDVVWPNEKDSQVLNDRILLLLDGYDEVAGVSDRIDRILLSALAFKNVILTSRPNAMDQNFAKHFNRRIENSGLGNEGINQYFDRYFQNDQEKGKKLQVFLARNPAIRDICNIPVNIAMLCFIWSEKSEDAEKISSMSDLYGQVVHHLGVRQSARQQPASAQDNKKTEGMRQNLDMKMGELKVLQHVAYQSLIGRELEDPNWKMINQSQNIRGTAERNNKNDISIQNSIDFLKRKSLIEDELLLDDVIQYGLLKPEEQNSSLKGKKATDLKNMTLDFLHKSFGEYLTAQYLVQQLESGTPKEQRTTADFIARHRNEPRLELILKFMAGILRTPTRPYEEDPASIKLFWDAILCNPNGALELGIDSKVYLLMNLLSQTKENGVIDPRIPNKDLAVKFIDCRVLENVLWWVDELKKSDYISPDIKEGLLKIFKETDLSWSRDRYQELAQELSLKLQRLPLDLEEFPVNEQKEESEEFGIPGSPGSPGSSGEGFGIDPKLIQEAIDGAVSSLIIKFSNDEQEQIIQKLLDDIRNASEPQIAKRKMNTLIKIVQAIKLSQENSQAFIEILIKKIFDEDLGQTSREGIVEALKASEEPVTLKEIVKEALEKIQIDPNTKKWDKVIKDLKQIVKLSCAAGDDDIGFMREVVKKIMPLLGKEGSADKESEDKESADKETADERLTELVEGCIQSVGSKLLQEVLDLIFPMFNNSKKTERVAGSKAIAGLINCKVSKGNKQLVIDIASKTIPLLEEKIGKRYFRALDVNHALVPLLAIYDEKEVKHIGEILISKVKNPDELEIREFGKTMELIAQQECSKKNLKLLQDMIKRLTPCLKSKREKVKGWAVDYIKTIAQAGGSSLCNKAIEKITPSLRDEDKDI